MTFALFVYAFALIALLGILCVALLGILCAMPDRRERLTAAALSGLLADHKDHSDERVDGETCSQAVARIAVDLADETIERLDS